MLYVSHIGNNMYYICVLCSKNCYSSTGDEYKWADEWWSERHEILGVFFTVMRVFFFFTFFSSNRHLFFRFSVANKFTYIFICWLLSSFLWVTGSRFYFRTHNSNSFNCCTIKYNIKLDSWKLKFEMLGNLSKNRGLTIQLSLVIHA